MIIDRNKLPNSLKDFVYVKVATSNSNAVESAIYREINSSWTNGGRKEPIDQGEIARWHGNHPLVP